MTNDLPLGHQYAGNICGGFGAPVQCDYILENGEKCGKSPGAHDADVVFWKEHLIKPNELRKRLGWVFSKRCENCGNEIEMMCFLGTNVCSENCRKDLESANANRS